MATACFVLAGCNDPIARPLDFFHGLEGGAIAQQRPPPPGVGQPYPKLGTVPAKPVVADQGYRRSLQSQLATERDRTERVAADQPIEAVPPPPGPSQAGPPSHAPVANATLDTAEAPPPPPPAAVPPAGLTDSATATQAPPTPAPADIGPAAGTPLTIAGAPDDTALPPIPAAPPPPATFEGVPAEPAPTPHLIPVHPSAPPGTPVFFPAASAVLPPSQTQALKDFASHRAGRTIEIIGLGDASADTPEGQATAIALALGRARAVADALAEQRVPKAAMRLGADAFGRGAVLRLLP